MPVKQSAVLAGIMLFFFSVIAFSYLYGPARRSFASPPQIYSAESTGQITLILESSAVKGRIALCFTRYLNALETKESRDIKATETAMNHGIFRKVYHFPPDSAWSEIRGTLVNRDDMRPTPEGFVGIFDDGRVYIQPLSRLSRLTEQAVIIIEPKVWSDSELTQIAEKLITGSISSDLVVIIRGSSSDVELFRHALAR